MPETTKAPEILFYHLERTGLLQVLATLLEKTLQRDWRAVVELPTKELVERLNNDLWTYREDSFLPHGASEDGFADEQPIYLCETGDNPNKAEIRFLVAGAEPGDPTGYQRLVYLFDGHDEEAVARARRQWKRLTGEGYDATYWKQDEGGGWDKKA